MSVVTAHMVYFCAFTRSDIFLKNARKLGVGRGQFDAGVNGLKKCPLVCSFHFSNSEIIFNNNKINVKLIKLVHFISFIHLLPFVIYLYVINSQMDQLLAALMTYSVVGRAPHHCCRDTIQSCHVFFGGSIFPTLP